MDTSHIFSLIPRFRAPKPRTSITALVLVIIVAIVAVGAIFVMNGSQSVPSENTVAIQPSLKTLLDNVKTDSSDPVYYAMKTNNLAETSIYKLSFDPSQPDTFVVKHNSDLHFFDTDTQNHTWLAGDITNLSLINPDKKKIETLITIPEGFVISNAKFFHNGQKIIYTMYDEKTPQDKRAVLADISETYIYDIASQKSTKITNRDDIDKTTLWKMGLNTSEERSAFEHEGVMSPDGKYLIATHCEDPAKDGTCPKGVRILSFDIETGAVKTVYRYESNAEGFTESIDGTANKIYSLAWSGDPHSILFSTPHALLRVNVDGGSPETIYQFIVESAPIQNISLTSLGRYIQVSIRPLSAIATKTLLDTSTGKFIMVPTPAVQDAGFLQFLTY